MSIKIFQSKALTTFILERHLQEFGPHCPICSYEGVVYFDEKDNRPIGIALQPEDQKGYRCSSRFEFDHIKPLSKGGENTPDNIWLLCPFCNRSKGDKWPVDSEFLFSVRYKALQWSGYKQHYRASIRG